MRWLVHVCVVLRAMGHQVNSQVFRTELCIIPKVSRWWGWLYKNNKKLPFEKSNSRDISTSPIEMIISMTIHSNIYMWAMNRRLVCFILKCWILFLSFVIRCDDTCGMLQWMHCMQTDYKYCILYMMIARNVRSIARPISLSSPLPRNFKCHDILQNIFVELSSIIIIIIVINARVTIYIFTFGVWCTYNYIYMQCINKISNVRSALNDNAH